MTGSGKLNLNFTADLTLNKNLPKGWTVVADSTCRSPAGTIKSMTEVKDVPLDRLAVGDTSRAHGYAYPDAPDGFTDGSETCNVEFLASPPPVPGKGIETRRSQWVALDTFCYQDGETKRGACRASR